MNTLLITGATRGLGLETVRAATKRHAHVIVAGRDPDATRRVAAEVGGEPLDLDLASLASVRAATAELDEVDSLVCNAGLQITGGLTRTADGFEETFQVNVLGHVALVDALLARRRAPRRLVWLGSSTHDPTQHTGMPAPSEARVESTARPSDDPQGRGAGEGRRRYTTSKLMTTALAQAYARERPELHVACFDPGLMPGTGLARDHSGWQRMFWSTAMKGLRVLPFASSPRRSGRALASVLLDEPPPGRSGEVIDFRLRPGAVSERALDQGFQDEVLRGCRALIS